MKVAINNTGAGVNAVAEQPPIDDDFEQVSPEQHSPLQ